MAERGETLADRFGEALRNARLRAQVTQDELAEQSGYGDKSTISKIEHGRAKRPPARERIEAIAEALDISPDGLLRAAGYLDPSRLDEEEKADIRSTIEQIRAMLDDLDQRI